jgi:hypothetical protein
MTQKAKRKLTDFTFEAADSHIALVGPAVGGPANLRTILLMKATGDIKDSDITEKLVEVEKAKFYQDLRNTLEENIREHFKDSLEYNWLYLEDFNDSVAIFSTSGSLYSVGYSLGDNGKYTFDAVAKEVDIKRVYEESPEGELLLSDEANKVVEEGVMTLLSKSLENPDTSKRASILLKSVKEKETKKMDEIQKAVAAAEGPLKEQITALQAKLEVFEQVEKAAKAKARQEALVEAVGEDKAVTLTKGVESLDDESFKALIDTFKAVKASQEEIMKQGDLMNQISGQTGDAQEQQNSTVSIIKAKYATK